MKISNTSEMRFMDRYAVEKLDIPEEILMENAGQASTYVLAQEIGIKDKRFVVFCGIGNNGGDGIVVATENSQQWRIGQDICCGRYEKV